ncbi:hypothetical protein CTI12_AA243240 [Artemisia annua]|uniref:Large ribosomal subunit protein uL23 N-terminal domain-containing protein n=1 Tax=Artemisia annua TaxID=35608 RepID=A0A2U1NPN2_ARTAN|nr:hypothetical protein CTI12_AA243240 [Artemisia annua]
MPENQDVAEANNDMGTTDIRECLGEVGDFWAETERDTVEEDEYEEEDDEVESEAVDDVSIVQWFSDVHCGIHVCKTREMSMRDSLSMRVEMRRSGVKKGDAKAQAVKTAKAVKTGSTFKKKAKKIRTKVTFHRPKTFKTDRNPKYPRICAPPRNNLDHYQILKYPLTTESAMKKIEDNNFLVFIVDLRADKKKDQSCSEEDVRQPDQESQYFYQVSMSSLDVGVVLESSVSN